MPNIIGAITSTVDGSSVVATHGRNRHVRTAFLDAMESIMLLLLMTLTSETMPSELTTNLTLVCPVIPLYFSSRG